MANDQEFLRKLQIEFLDELKFLLEACEESYLKLENPDNRAEELAKIFRLAHSIKGAGAAVGYEGLASFAHTVEDLLALLRSNPALVDTEVVSVLLKCGDAFRNRTAELRQDPPPSWDITPLQDEVKVLITRLKEGKPRAEASPAEPSMPPMKTPSPPPSNESSTIKVDSQRVDTLLDIVGELVVIKSQILNETGRLSGNSRLGTIVSLLDKTIRDLQDRTLSMRLTPLKGLFLKVQRVARDLSIRLKKPIDLVLEGGEVEIDRSMVEQLSDPLLHLVRNCLDHGIESTAARKERGKDEKGRIRIAASQAGGRVCIRVSDDGAGIPREKIIKKAKEAGLLPVETDEAALPDEKVFDFIFAPGFSTADSVTDISGRGVGMNVVRENLEGLKGRVDVQSALGKGTTFIISIPVTSAITDGLLVRVNGQVYILPIDGIRELVELNTQELVKVHSNKRLIQVRGKFFPLIQTRELLKSAYWDLPKGSPTSGGGTMVVLYEHATGCVGLAVDGVLGQAQVVLKPLGHGVKERQGIGGAAILGDGKVALLLDVDGLAYNLAQEFYSSHADLAA